MGEWVKISQSGTAPIVCVYKGPRGLRLVVSTAYYTKSNGVHLDYFGPGVELYNAKGKLLASGRETVKAYLQERGIEYPLVD
jgi:hypothetical protein